MQKLQKGFWNSLSFLKRNKILLIFSILFLAFFVIFVPNNFVSAQSVTDLLSSPTKTLINTVLTIITTGLSVIAWTLGKLIVLTISMLIIPVLGYNNFGDSNLVSMGWPLVRDVVNMFVIVILLVIAIKTMIGAGKGAGWGQQLPRFFLAIVAVNFSRTITVLMIDASQVVMMTFVNALRDIAAGNFVGLFQLDSMMGIDTGSIMSQVSGGGSGLDSFGYLGSMYATVVLLAVVLATMVLLAGIFVYRIVILWILTILSPIAFFMGGIKDVVGSAAGQNNKWWKTFIATVTLGPIMSFFLWLGLAAASQGSSIASTEKFQAPTDQTTYGLINEVFQVDKLLSLLIGYLIIVVGLQASSGAAGEIGGGLSKYFSKEGGMGMGKKIAVTPLALGARGGRWGARQTGRQIERRTGVGESLGRGMLNASSDLNAASTRGGLSGFVAGIGGKALGSLGANIENTASSVRKEDRKAAQEKVKNMSGASAEATSQFLSNPENLSEANRATRIGQMGSLDVQQEYAYELATNPQKSKQLENELKRSMGDTAGQAEADRRKENALRFVLANKEIFSSDEGGKKKVTELEQKNLHLLDNNTANERSLVRSGDPAQLAKRKRNIDNHVKSEKFDYNNLSVDAVQDPVVEQSLRDKIVRTETDKETGVTTQVNAWDDLSAGKLGNQKVKDHFRNINSKGSIIATTVPQFTSNPRKQTERFVSSGVDLSGLNTPVKTAFLAEAEVSKRGKTPAEVRKISSAKFSANGDAAEIGIDATGNIAPNMKATVTEVVKNRPESLVSLGGQIGNAIGSRTSNDTARIIADNVDQTMRKKLKAKFDGAQTPADEGKIRDAVDRIIGAITAEQGRLTRAGQSTKAIDKKEKDMRLFKRSIS